MSIKMDSHRYDSLIDNQKPITKRPMDSVKRAAQFAPFAALTGYEDQIKETARLTEDSIFLDENEVSILDRQLRYIKEHLLENITVAITYFIPDSESHLTSKKSGGEYVTRTGIIKKIDTYDRRVILTDDSSIYIDRILSIEGQIFEEMDNEGS